MPSCGPTIKVGEIYGRLEILDLPPPRRRPGGGTTRFVLALCECGNTKEVRATDLQTGKIKSCGCLLREASRRRATRHGMAFTDTYACWRNMVDRCENPKASYFKNYGGKGVSVCEEWRRDFRNFLTDMGPRPPGLTLDRIDPYGNYCADNCRWADRFTQARNTRKAFNNNQGEERQ